MPGVRETVRAAATRLAGRLRGSHASYNAASEQPEQAGPVHEPVPAAPAGDEAAPLDGADVDGFPPLPFLPFHRNALFARGEVVGLPAPVAPWDLPGNEHYPRVHGRRVNALWLEHPIVPCLVRYKIFFLPVVLLCQYEWWRGYFSSAIPHNMFSIEVDPDIFGFLLEILISPSGMIGTEPGMNLVIITAAMAMALAFGMGDEFNKLSWTFRRYLVQRLLYRNPYQPDIENILDHDYFVYRSEELYRSYRMVCLHEQLASVLSPVEIAILYWLVIPQDLWPALTDTFEDHFNWLIEFIALRHGVSPEHRFFDIYRELFREAGYLAPGWLRQPPAPIPHPTNDATVPPNDLHDEGEFHIPNPFEHAQYPATHSGVKIHLDVPDLVASPIARPSSAPAVIMTSPLSNDNALVNDTSEEAKEKALLAELFEPLD